MSFINYTKLASCGYTIRYIFLYKERVKKYYTVIRISLLTSEPEPNSNFLRKTQPRQEGEQQVSTKGNTNYYQLLLILAQKRPQYRRIQILLGK